MGSSAFLPRIDLPFASSGLLEGEEAFSPSTENGFVSVAGASGFPAAGVVCLVMYNVFAAGGDRMSSRVPGITYFPAADGSEPVFAMACATCPFCTCTIIAALQLPLSSSHCVEVVRLPEGFKLELTQSIHPSIHDTFAKISPPSPLRTASSDVIVPLRVDTTTTTTTPNSSGKP